MNIALTPLISLIAGILILVVPRLLNYIVAIYLIIIGLVGIFGGGFNLRMENRTAGRVSGRLFALAALSPGAVASIKPCADGQSLLELFNLQFLFPEHCLALLWIEFIAVETESAVG